MRGGQKLKLCVSHSINWLTRPVGQISKEDLDRADTIPLLMPYNRK